MDDLKTYLNLPLAPAKAVLKKIHQLNSNDADQGNEE
jgi:hypothetical protein